MDGCRVCRRTGSASSAASPSRGRRWENGAFKSPSRRSPGRGVRDASAFGPSAPQMKLQFDFLPGTRRRRAERGLPLPERLRTRRRRCASARAGLDPRRRLHDRLRLAGALRRAAAGAARRRGGGDRELPARRARLPAPRRAGGRGIRLRRERRTARSGRRARLGARQHRRLRRRSRERHDLRRVGGRHERGRRCSACPRRAACSGERSRRAERRTWRTRRRERPR